MILRIVKGVFMLKSIVGLSMISMMLSTAFAGERIIRSGASKRQTKKVAMQACEEAFKTMPEEERTFTKVSEFNAWNGVGSPTCRSTVSYEAKECVADCKKIGPSDYECEAEISYSTSQVLTPLTVAGC